MFTVQNKKFIELKKGKTTIFLGLGVGSYNPDESKAKGFDIDKAIAIKPWLKFEDIWYSIKNAWKYNCLEDIETYFKRDCYSEEMFLEKVCEHI